MNAHDETTVTPASVTWASLNTPCMSLTIVSWPAMAATLAIAETTTKTRIVSRPSSWVWARRRNGRAIGRHDLGLVRKHFAAARVDRHLEPVHVVGAVRLVVPEGLDAGEVLDAPALGVEQRLVDPVVMRIAVHVGDRSAEGD